jgi:hypothetical protein
MFWRNFSPPYITLTTDATSSSETLVTIHQTALRHISEDSNFHSHHRENVNYHTHACEKEGRTSTVPLFPNLSSVLPQALDNSLIDLCSKERSNNF